MVRIENWSVVSKDPYYPDHNGRLHGTVYGHPVHGDGEVVTTSRIASSEGHKVTTRSGTVYHLGEPSEHYREWVRKELEQEIDQDTVSTTHWVTRKATFSGSTKG